MKTSGIVVLLCLLTGCVNVQPRPSSWPSDKPLTNAHDVEGKFQDTDSGLRAALFPYHFESVATLSDCIVTILPGQKIEFRLVGPSDRVESQVWPYEIRDGWLVASQREGINREGVLATQSVSLFFRRDVTDALVFRMIVRDIGMMFFVPAVTKDEVWHRLPPTPAAPSESMALQRHDPA